MATAPEKRSLPARRASAMTGRGTGDMAGTALVPVQSVPPAAPSGGPDLWEYLRIMWRRWPWVALCVALCVTVAAFITFRMTKIYRATTTVRIETQAPQVLGRDVENVVEMGTGSFWTNVEYYETQYRIITSRKVALAVVDAYRLNEDPRFMELPRDQMPATREAAAERLQSILTVEPVKDSRLAMVHVDYPDPEKARLLADAVAEAYVRQNLEVMHERTLEAVDWLSERLDQAHEALRAAESELLRFKKEHNILSISLEDRQSHITAQMQTAAQNLTLAKAKRIELQARKQAMAKVAKVDDPLAIPVNALNNNPLIQQLKQNYAQLSQEYGELSARYGANYPKMQEIRAKMERIEKDIRREVANVIHAVDAELNEARLTEAGLKKALETLEEQAQDLASNRGRYNELERKVENAKQVYQLLKTRSEEAKLARFLKVNNVEILDRAVTPKSPIRPRVVMNLALAFILGLVLGVGVAVMVETADRTIKTQEDIEALGVPFLGIVPSIDSTRSHGHTYGVYEKKRSGKRRKKRKKDSTTGPDPKVDPDTINYDNFVFDYPKSQVAESMRSIRTNLLFTSADKPVQTLLVTSPSPQEGKTTVATNLAIIMAQSGSRVLLVDTDMRKPRVHKAFGIKRPGRGMSTLVLGESTFEDSIVSTRIPNLDVLVCGPTPPNPSELLHTEAFARVVHQLVARYDRVIFDSPPVGIVTDAAILSTMVDGTVLIVKSLKTTKDAARHAVSVLQDIDSPIFGAVLNDLDLTDKKYGQYYYYYYSKYGYYYGEGDDRASDPGQA